MTINYDWYTTNYRHAVAYETLMVKATVYNKAFTNICMLSDQSCRCAIKQHSFIHFWESQFIWVLKLKVKNLTLTFDTTLIRCASITCTNIQNLID